MKHFYVSILQSIKKFGNLQSYELAQVKTYIFE